MRRQFFSRRIQMRGVGTNDVKCLVFIFKSHVTGHLKRLAITRPDSKHVEVLDSTDKRMYGNVGLS